MSTAMPERVKVARAEVQAAIDWFREQGRPVFASELEKALKVLVRHKMKTLHSSNRHDWQTPDWILDRVNLIAPIALDPCTTIENPTRAWNLYTKETDGLAQEWTATTLQFDGLVYVNPPYGRELAKWSTKIIAEAKIGAPIIALVPARPDAAWFRNMKKAAKVVGFFHKRVQFVGADNGAPFPSALFAFNVTKSRFTNVFHDVAWFA